MRDVRSSRDPQELCLRLLHCETEDEVVSLLKEHRLWEDRAVWRPYGDVKNNRGVVGNQQSHPVAALVEKLVNCIDAVLIAECHRAGVDPTGPDAPKDMRQAVQRFFDVPGGLVQNISSTGRTRLAERIQLVACGTKAQPAYMILDDGEGQTPDRFPDTFLSLLRENKTGIPFVQGKFNMGGTGVLQFAGTNSFQLIVSRRHGDIPATGSSPALRNHWGFTLVRRIDPTQEQPQSTYVYLAPGGQVPSFAAESLNLLPGDYPDAYGTPMAAGTCIKLWNYKLQGGLKTIATLDMRYALEEHIQEPALPIRIRERRAGFRAHTYDTTLSGLAAVLSDNREDIEPGLDTGSPLDVPGVGRVDMRLIVTKEKGKEYPAGVFFTVNGQLHGRLGADFISRRTKFDYVADSTIVRLDCSSLPSRIREDVFLASRDRMRDCEERKALEDYLVDHLKEHPGLRELNARRRQERLSSALSEEETSKVFQSLVRSDPTLAKLFGKGQTIKVPIGPLPEPEPFTGQRFPTYFRVAKEPKGGLIRQCPRNRNCRVEFETDAENDYFSRTVEAGHLEVQGAPARVGGIHLWNGKALLRFAPPTSCNLGDRLTVRVLVNDVSRTEALQSSFVIEVEEEAPPALPGAPPVPPGALTTGLPNIQEVTQKDWAIHKFNESSGLSLKSGDEDTLDVYVNMDNIFLRNEIARRRDLDPKLLQHWFKYGLCLLALGMLYDEKKRIETAEEKNGPSAEERMAQALTTVSKASCGLAITVIPVISQLSKGIEHGAG